MSPVHTLWGDRRGFRFLWPSLAVSGTAAGALIVVAGGRVGPLPGTVPVTTWFGLLASRAVDPAVHPATGLALLAGVAGLVGVWLCALRSLRSTAMSPARVWALAVCWSLPLLLGPPLLSGDAWSYAAQGLMVVHHLDPYKTGPVALGPRPVLAAVDPRWRSTPSPYGPLATAVEWASAEAGRSALGAVIVLRVVAACSVTAIGVLALDMAPLERRAPVLALTVLNPVVLLQVVSAAHFEGLMAALLLGGLAALRRRLRYLAVVLVCLAAAVKAPAAIAAAAVMVDVVANTPPGAARVRTALGVGGTALGVVAVCTSLVPDGWGWVRTALSTPGHAHSLHAPTALLAAALTPLSSAAHVVSPATLTGACRTLGLVIALTVVGYLIVTARRRTVAATAGGGMIAVAFLGPVLYPWYPLWGGLCLAPQARARRYEAAVWFSVIAAFTEIPGLAAPTIRGLELAAVVAAAAIIAWKLRNALRRPVAASPHPQRVDTGLDAGELQ